MIGNRSKLLLHELENEINSSSLYGRKGEKTTLSSKFAIYNFMLEKLSITKVQLGILIIIRGYYKIWITVELWVLT